MYTPETKWVAMTRLKQEGRWAEASEFKEKIRRKYRNQRYTRKQAVELAWTAMCDQYPPLPPPPPKPVEVKPVIQAPSNGIPDDILDGDDDFEWPPDAEPSADQITADCRWVYRNITRKNIQKKDCPSAGAWGMLHWARRNQAKFYEQIVVKLASGKLGVGGDDSSSESADDTTELEALLAAARKSNESKALS